MYLMDIWVVFKLLADVNNAAVNPGIQVTSRLLIICSGYKASQRTIQEKTNRRLPQQN